MPSIRKRSFAAEQLARQRKKHPVVWVIFGVVVVALVVVGYALYSRFVAVKTTAPQEEEIKSIAVLPFRDMSPEKDQEWFCDGIADAILSKLTHVGDLLVPASTSSFAFKDKDISIIDIGSQLNVESVLEGSIVKSGNRLRITAQLIKVDDGFHIWSETYNRQAEDVFPLIEEISLAVVEALKVKLLSNERAAIVKRPTENTEAFNLYLMGHKSIGIRGHSLEQRQQMIKYCKQAIELDKNFALAYSAIAIEYMWLGYSNLMIPKEAYLEAKEWANKALNIDSTLAEAYTVLGFTYLYYDWDWPEADINFKRAIEYNPGNAFAFRWYKDYFLVMGRFDEALEKLKQSYILDPLSSNMGFWAYFCIHAGRYDEAKEYIRKALDESPDNWWAHLAFCRVSYLQGNYDRAVNEIKIVAELIPASSIGGLGSGALGYIYAKKGDKDKAEQILRDDLKRSKNERMAPSSRAFIYTGLGDYDKAFEWLEKAYEERDSFVLYLKIFPEYEPLRSDTRYKTLMKKMGFE